MTAFAEGPGRRSPRWALIDFGCDDRCVSGPCSSCRVRSIVWCGGRARKGRGPGVEGRGRAGSACRPLGKLGTVPSTKLRTRSLFCRIMFFLCTRIRISYLASVPGRGREGQASAPPEAGAAEACPYKGGCTAPGYGAGGRAPIAGWHAAVPDAEHRWRPEGRRYDDGEGGGRQAGGTLGAGGKRVAPWGREASRRHWWSAEGRGPSRFKRRAIGGLSDDSRHLVGGRDRLLDVADGSAIPDLVNLRRPCP